MDLAEVVSHFGTQQKAAAALGMTQGSISAWRDGIPIPRQYQIEVLTNGALLADRQQQPTQDAQASAA